MNSLLVIVGYGNELDIVLILDPVHVIKFIGGENEIQKIRPGHHWA